MLRLFSSSKLPSTTTKLNRNLKPFASSPRTVVTGKFVRVSEITPEQRELALNGQRHFNDYLNHYDFYTAFQ